MRDDRNVERGILKASGLGVRAVDNLAVAVTERTGMHPGGDIREGLSALGEDIRWCGPIHSPQSAIRISATIRDICDFLIFPWSHAASGPIRTRFDLAHELGVSLAAVRTRARMLALEATPRSAFAPG